MGCDIVVERKWFVLYEVWYQKLSPVFIFCFDSSFWVAVFFGLFCTRIDSRDVYKALTVSINMSWKLLLWLCSFGGARGVVSCCALGAKMQVLVPSNDGKSWRQSRAPLPCAPTMDCVRARKITRNTREALL